MPLLTHVTITALKDRVRVVTARKKLTYKKVEGLPNGGMPEGQDAIYENEHALTMVKDQSVELDLSDAQLAEFQKAVDAGDLHVVIHEAPIAQNVRVLSPSASAAAKPVDPPKDQKAVDAGGKKDASK